MRYSMTFLEDDYAALTSHLFDSAGQEQAAYLLCGLSQASSETRLLVRRVIPVAPEHIISASAVHMQIAAPSFLRAMKQADLERLCFVFAHSHPADVPHHSEQDDREERKLFATAYNRIHHDAAHGSVVFSSPDVPSGRVWLADGSTYPIDVVRVMGRRFRFLRSADEEPIDLSLFDRQVRAFGPDLQRVLRTLTIGVVGAGGTGSSTIEQLIRIGIGSLVVADPQCLADSNVTRVYGSRLSDAGSKKVAIMARLSDEIGLGTSIQVIPKSITFESALKQFRECDVIFGSTDDQWGRSLLNALAVYYYIPVFDMGVRIDSDNGSLRSVQGRITTLLPGSACLWCRKRITAQGVRAEVLEALNPAEAARLRREGYAPELADPDPAVVSFTTAIAASAVSQLLHRLTGFMGEAVNSTEVIHRFDENRIRTNSREPDADCFCSDRTKWGRGDCRQFLDTTWRPE